jgi:hypothetical protein
VQCRFSVPKIVILFSVAHDTALSAGFVVAPWRLDRPTSVRLFRVCNCSPELDPRRATSFQFIYNVLKFVLKAASQLPAHCNRKKKKNRDLK